MEKWLWGRIGGAWYIHGQSGIQTAAGHLLFRQAVSSASCILHQAEVSEEHKRAFLNQMLAIPQPLDVFGLGMG